MVNCAWVMRWVFVVQPLSHVQLCDRIDCSMPGSSVLRYLPELAQLPVHWVSDVIQLSHPVSLLSIWPQSFPASVSFLMSWLFASGGWSIGASASAAVLPMNIQGWFPLGLTGLISLAIQGTLKSLLQHHNLKASILWLSAFFIVQFSHPYVTTGKKHSFDYTDLCQQSDVSAF